MKTKISVKISIILMCFKIISFILFTNVSVSYGINTRFVFYGFYLSILLFCVCLIYLISYGIK